MFQTGKNKWRSLENTAKIFPATSSAKDERVFRFACELTGKTAKGAGTDAGILSVFSLCDAERLFLELYGRYAGTSQGEGRRSAALQSDVCS